MGDFLIPSPDREGESIRAICDYQRLSERLAPTVPTPYSLLRIERASQLGLFVIIRDCRSDSPLQSLLPIPDREGESIRAICYYERLSERLAPTVPTPYSPLT